MIHDVSDTAYLVAATRARETARPDALFRDPLAGRLAGERGDRILAKLPASFMNGWTIVIRTVIIDTFIRDAVAGGVDLVLNLGAGLDTRPYRMGLPADIRWVEVDYPEVLAAKASALAGAEPQCRLEQVGLDLTDRAARRDLLARAGDEAQAILVLTEGVVPYLSTGDAGTLADDLAACEAAQGWIIDYFSAASRKYRQKRNRTRFMANAPFLFEPDDWLGFFTARGWWPREVRYLTEEGRRLRRPIPLPLRMKLVVGLTRLFASRARREEMLRFAGYVLLEREIPAS